MLTVYSTQGSPGASTTALHLAAHWASMGREVLLIEADPAGGSLSRNLGIQFTPGSASFVASGQPVLSSHLIDHAQDVLFENLHVMPAPATPAGATGIFRTFAESSDALRTISENEMAVIIDGGRITADTAMSMLTTGAAGVLVVCRDNSQLSSLEPLSKVFGAGPGHGGPRGFVAVRVGTYGFEVLLDRPVQAPEGWQAASGGYVLELPQGITAEDLESTAQGPTLCPALVPVGDTLEGPLLLNVEEIGCLIVSGPGLPSVNLLNAVVGTLGSSPLAGDIRIITVGLDTPAGLPGWERVHSTSFDSPQLEELIYAAHTGSGASLDVLVVGPGNDLLIQRAGQVATTPGSRLAVVGATSSVAARWPWRIHVDETTTAVVHPIACTMVAAQAMAPAMTQLLSEVTDPSLLAPPRF